MIFDDITKNKFLDGYFIFDGVCGFNENKYAFILIENNNNKLQYRDPKPKTKFLFISLERPIEKRFYAVTTEYFDFSTIATVMIPGKEDYVSVDVDLFVFSWDNNFEDHIDGTLPGVKRVSTISKIVRVGQNVYALGGALRIYKRLGKDHWKNNLSTLPIPNEMISGDYSHSFHFRDMAGFSEADMYAVGDVGTVYHFNGNAWTQIVFPTNIELSTVTCADDGNVYISDKDCSIWLGRNSTWKKIIENSEFLPFFDSAWFDGRVWFANDYGIWVLENDQLVLAKDSKHKPIPEDVAVLCGRIDISPDNKRMLVCGQRGAAVYDGERWETLFTCDLPIEDEA
ncbi:hypothetical protein [Flavobacterium sp. FlaQc-48]|uniref:hypothetical protein n=1 Tax=Flavobacterium sp. FlaQc-48 TaxID=3374181 RepID=UPI003757A0F6